MRHDFGKRSTYFRGPGMNRHNAKLHFLALPSQEWQGECALAGFYRSDAPKPGRMCNKDETATLTEHQVHSAETDGRVVGTLMVIWTDGTRVP